MELRHLRYFIAVAETGSLTEAAERRLVASTRGIALLPAYAKNFLPWSVISRPLEGVAPTIDLVIGYSNANTSPILKLFLSRADDLVARVSQKVR